MSSFLEIQKKLKPVTPEALRSATDCYDSYPVPVLHICEKLGLNIVEASEISENKNALFNGVDTITVFKSENARDVYVQRYVIALQLAFLIGIEEEYEAYDWAIRLLLPFSKLEYVMRIGLEFNHIALFFAVTETVLAERVGKLGLYL